MILEEKYSRQAYLKFFEEKFLPEDFNVKDEEIKPETKCNFIKKVTLIGSVNSLQLKVYEIVHSSEYDPRVGLSRETFRLMSQYRVKRALILFTSKKSNNYRLSLITIDLELKGKRVLKEYSNPKRYSFYLGPDAKIHTPYSFLVKLGRVKNIKDLVSRFDIEVVTQEFYREISNWYFWTVKNATFPKDAEDQNNGRNIAIIRLITRLIFIWFMKQKKLVPGHLFDREKLNGLLKDLSRQGDSYYKAILQNLFFATLNTPIGDRRFRHKESYRKGFNPDYGDKSIYRYEEDFKNPDEISELFLNIPFLNGGLFECLDRKEEKIVIDGFTRVKKNQPRVPNFLFFSEEQSIDLNQEYGTKNKNYKVRGLLHILNTYNFTIDESTPVDIEISLDPELLGRVFENLLASYNPETATTARKATGSYYTPRPIVDYMVDESLKEYFKTKLSDSKDTVQKVENLLSYNIDDNPFTPQETKVLINAIYDLKVVDPAVGSGAFPMGILQKLVLILSKLDSHNKIWKQEQVKAIDKNITDAVLKNKLKQKIEENFKNNELNYGRKLYLIQNCIYGVDIQPIAIQIAKLRFFISLLVDEKVDESQDNFGIEPLPNLETKFVAANSLIGLSGQMVMKSKWITDLESQLKDVRMKYFNANYKEEKEKLRHEDQCLRLQIAEEFKKIGFQPEDTKKIVSWEPYDANTFAEWFDPEWMFGMKEGFDIVIANPPYIKEYVKKSAFDGLRDFLYYQGKMDLWYLFACKSIDFLKNDSGILTFIAQNNWVTNYGASILRNKIINETQILTLIDFGDYKIFESAGIQTMVMIFQKNANEKEYRFDYRRISGRDLKFDDVIDILNKAENKKIEYLNPRIKRDSYNDKTLTFGSSDVEKILNKMKLKSNFKLDPVKEIANGIHHHHDRINKQRANILKNKFKVGSGIFVLSDDEKKRMNLDNEELGLIKPSYTTKEIGRWYGNPKNKEWVVYTDSSFKGGERIKDYPKIKKHLDQFKKVITSDNKPYGLHRSRDEYFFKGEKIISVRKCSRPTFAYIDFDSYVSATFYVIKTKRINQEFLVALLNSKLIAFWLKYKGKMQGNNYQIDKEPIINLPIVDPSKEKQKLFIKIVDKILNLIKSSDYLQNKTKQGKAYEYERQIDKMVYKLYGLTEEEIGIVENN